MITDRQTNRVYFSEWTRRDFPSVTAALCSALDKHSVEYGFLRHTNDYWCRDYMPVQVEKARFVQYTYRPDYLTRKNEGQYITDPTRTMADLGIETVKTALVIDGGNVIRCPDRVIMTEKVFCENGHLNRKAVIDELEKAFGAELVFIPWDRSEEYGHADGVVRWVADNKVLLTAYEASRYFCKAFRAALEKHFEVIPMEFTTRPRRRELTWAYVNFLQTDKVIVLPAFGTKEDRQALAQIEAAFPEYHGRIEQVDATELLAKGGAFNCISWTVKA